MMHGHEKSDSAIVARKPANKAGRPAAEPVEPRAGAKGNADQQSTRRAQSRASVSQALERIRQAARTREEGTVHRSAAPCQRRYAPAGIFRAQAESRAGCGWVDVERSTGRTWSATLRICTTAFIGEPTGRYRRVGGTFQNRMDGSGRWASPRWKTRSSSAQWSRC